MSSAGFPQRLAPSGERLNVQYDSLASLLKTVAPALGTGAAGETQTGVAMAQAAAAAILGDGTPANPGLGLPALQARLEGFAGQLVAGLRWDTLLQRLCRTFFIEIEAAIRSGAPSAWNLCTGGATHPLDAFLLRSNGLCAPAAGSPAAGTLTAVSAAGGGMAPADSGRAPYVVHTLVGQYDWQEGLPSGEATRAAIGAVQNGYSYQIAGTVPAGVSKVRIYRSLYGAASGGPYAWATDAAATAGSSYPAIALTVPDSGIRQDWQPPSWGAYLQAPETALLFGLAFAMSSAGSLAYGPNGQLNPLNVALGPATGQLGLGNAASTALFGEFTIGTGYTPNSFQAANVGNVQGFAGGTGIQARVTTALGSASWSPTISYTYFDAAHGWGSAQTQSGVTPSAGLTTGAVGDLIAFSVPAGRIVQAVGVTGESGSAISGVLVFESPQVRAY
jgi:hypothetical protein